MAVIETDYFVTGAGAMAMAFVDTLLTESPEARVVMADRRDRPGGHWNDAYSYVRLHQPSAWYGVASRELGERRVERAGVNAGMLSLASGAEVTAHFDQVMQHRFVPSGRVQWLPTCEHVASGGRDHSLRSLVTGEGHTVTVRRQWVNATHAQTEVPSTHPPKYGVSAGVACVPCNELPKLARPFPNYTVVGSGKTGMDACLWLLEHGVPQERIRWIMPRDAWLIDRANLQPGPGGWQRYFGNVLAQFEAICAASDVEDLFHRLEASGALMRIDEMVEPAVYRCAIVSRGELAQLRRISDVVRLGRVRALEPGRILLEHGELPADPDALYVDCSASAIQPTPDVPVFEPGTINLLMVRMCQPVFSASVIAWVESHIPDLAEKNRFCAPVRGPSLPIDFLRMWLPTIRNSARWNQQPEMKAWLGDCRLNAQAVVLRGVEPTQEMRELLKAVGTMAGQAAERIPGLLAQEQATSSA